mmetsp:Transcript_24256/g.59368  ORF Transcript_24256/g.59368 Transcript_24256/m.59368 type:complete len:216 (+) Transcript_24256:163-810(+)
MRRASTTIEILHSFFRKSHPSLSTMSLGATDGDHLDWGDGVVVACWDLADLFNQIQTLRDLSKDRVSRWSTLVEPIQEGVVVDIDKELGTSRFGSSSVGHGKSSDIIGDALVVLANLVGDVSSRVTSVGLAVTRLEGGSTFGSSSSRTARVGVLGVGASELVHKVGDDTVEVDSIVVSTVGQIDKVPASDGHLLGVQFSLESTHGGGEGSDSHDV